VADASGEEAPLKIKQTNYKRDHPWPDGEKGPHCRCGGKLFIDTDSNGRLVDHCPNCGPRKVFRRHPKKEQ
jgi:hypothetical protein